MLHLMEGKFKFLQCLLQLYKISAFYLGHLLERGDGFMVFNSTFNIISVISLRLVLLEETGVSGGNH